MKFHRVVIAEKPSLARLIADALGVKERGDGYLHRADTAITWCVGHLFEQAKPEDYDARYARWRFEDLPIIPAQWKLLPKRETRKQLDVVTKLVRAAGEIVHAGDPDREGQLLVDEVIEHAQTRARIYRAWLQDLTDSGIRKAFASLKPGEEFKLLHDEALARARADWLIGMNLTRAYTLVRQGKGEAMHIGRVQTPTLALVVQRDREIESFAPQTYFVVRALLRHPRGTFWARWMPAGKEEEEARIFEEAKARAIIQALQGEAGRIVETTVTRKKDAPPLPYTLADLQKEAHKFMGLSPKKTLDIAQRLYEERRLITYPRTDCPYLPEAEYAHAPDTLATLRANFGASWEETCSAKVDASRKGAAWNDAKLGAHHGLIPTRQRLSIAELTKEEAGVYRLIVKRYLAQFLPDHLYEATTVVAEVAGHRLKASGTVTLEDGWRRLYASDKKKSDKEETDEKLPVGMKKGDGVDVEEARLDAKKTTPPPRFDGASLIDAMQHAHRYVSDPAMKAKLRETQGIGTEATRAGIIEALVRRGYLAEVKKSKGKGTEFVSTPKGRALIDAVSDKLKSVDLTAWFEGKLDEVRLGKLTLADYEHLMHRFVQRLLAEINAQRRAA